VIFAEAGDEASILASMEDGLRYRGLAGVVGEVAKLSMSASRRLKLAAEKSGQMAIAIRRWQGRRRGRPWPADGGGHALEARGDVGDQGVAGNRPAAVLISPRPVNSTSRRRSSRR
jgi:hypothetical protein